jgi:hypothetical protein
MVQIVFLLVTENAVRGYSASEVYVEQCQLPMALKFQSQVLSDKKIAK